MTPQTPLSVVDVGRKTNHAKPLMQELPHTTLHLVIRLTCAPQPTPKLRERNFVKGLEMSHERQMCRPLCYGGHAFNTRFLSDRSSFTAHTNPLLTQLMSS